MFKDTNKLVLTGSTLLFFSFLLLLLNELHIIFNVLFAICCIIGLFFLLLYKIKVYKDFKITMNEIRENAVIEMTISDDGSYETVKSPFSKGQLKTIKSMYKDKFLPIIFLIVLIAIMIFLLVRLIMAM